MRTAQDIVFGVTGQVVYFDAPEGRPSAVTSVKAYSWDVGDVSDWRVATGAGSVESNPDTLVSSTSGAGQSDPRVINVDDATGFEVGRNYLLTAVNGAHEWIECESFTDTTVTAKHPLHNAYTDAATLQSTRIQATIDPTWVADLNNLAVSAGANPAYRLRWVYVVDGTTHVADSYFNLVRYAGIHGVRPQDIELAHPGWLDRLPTDHYNDQGQRLIDEAYRSVKIDLMSVEIDDAGVANSEVIDELTRWRAVELGEFARLMAGVQGAADTHAAARQAYRERLDSLARITTKVPIRDETGGAAKRIALGLTRR